MITAKPTPISTYTFNEHRHRFGLWTAARAQRAFSNNEAIANAINITDLRSFVENDSPVSQEDYDAMHSKWCNSIMSHFSIKGCEYGRAAKIVAIYLKTTVILPTQGLSHFCDVIHPPIDHILLHNISRKKKDILSHFDKIKWTTLPEDQYWEMIEEIRKHFGACNWRLENYWTTSNLMDDIF